eukprot:jgi/Bigna1/144057/aug1.83_g18765
MEMAARMAARMASAALRSNQRKNSLLVTTRRYLGSASDACDLDRRLGDKELEGMKKINLLRREQNWIHRHVIPGMTYVTFFQISGGSDAEPGKLPTEYLQNRLRAIVKENPWLRSRLAYYNRELVLAYHDESSSDLGSEAPNAEEHDMKDIFHIYDSSDVQISVDMPHSKLPEAVSSMCVPLAAKTVGTNCPRFKLSIVRDSENPQRFAVVASMCHIMGDGATFYKIWNMFGQDSDITALNPSRYMKIENTIKQSFGLPEYNFQWKFVFNIVWENIITLFTGKKHVDMRAFAVNESWIAAQKVAYKEGESERSSSDPEYLTTNDILSQWILKFIKPDIGTIPLNVRVKSEMGTTGELPTENDAGNYIGDLLFLQEDYESPALIRKAISNRKRSAEPKTKLPDLVEVFGKRLHLVTNISGGYSDVDLDGCHTVVHYPMYDWQTLCSENKSLSIIWRPCKDKLAVMMTGVDVGERLDDALSNGELEWIDPDFPIQINTKE